MSDDLPAASASASASSRSPSPADAPLPEPLFPQISLRFLFALMVLAAAVLWAIRAAVVGGYLWAQCAVVMMGTVAGSFIAYALLFLLALAFAMLSGSAVQETSPQSAAEKPSSSVGRSREDG